MVLSEGQKLAILTNCLRMLAKAYEVFYIGKGRYGLCNR
jgi:hypothetical protein